MKKNNLWDRYCKDVRKNLFCSRQSKQKILHALQCDIEDFLTLSRRHRTGYDRAFRKTG